MIEDLRKNAVWLPTEDFQKYLLPKPPPGLLPTPQEIAAIGVKFKNMIDRYKQRARRETANVLPEEQLAKEFCEIINDNILDTVKGKAVRSEPDALTSRPGSPGADTSQPVCSSSTQSTARYPLSHVHTVPGYVMRLFPHKYDKVDEQWNKADAALFRDDVKLEQGRLNWVHQRLFADFKTQGTQNDPFEDSEGSDFQPFALARAKVRGQLLAYASRVFSFQHRSALFSLFVIHSEFRFMRWDRSGVFTTERMDYVEKPSVLIELLLGFLALDDSNQGTDTTVNLLDKSSDEFKFMSRVPASLPPELKIVSSQEESLLPTDVPREPVSSPTGVALSAAQPTDAHVSGDSDPLGSDSESDATPQMKPKEGSFVFDYVLDYFKASVSEEWPCYCISIGSDTFLVGRPIYETTGLIGRGTRGFVAWHVQDKRFVFLKDVWRPLYERVLPEGDILETLNDAKIPHVPTLVCHASIGNRTTIVSDFDLCVDNRTNDQRKAAWKASKKDKSESHKPGTTQETSTTSTDESRKNGKKRTASEREPPMQDDLDRYFIRHLTHYRMATKEVCLPLNAFQTSEQLVTIIRDSIDAHAAAVEQCKLIHRDISSGNILILPTVAQLPGDRDLTVVWQGFLSDWELSKPVPESNEEERARQPVRTGTWRYMSRACLLDPLHVVETADEIESFFNVLLYHAIRFLPHNAEEEVSTFLTRYFLESKKVRGRLTCGQEKKRVMASGTLTMDDSEQELAFGTPATPNVSLNSVLKQLLSWFRARYQVLKYEESLKVASPYQSSPATSNGIEPASGQAAGPSAPPPPKKRLLRRPSTVKLWTDGVGSKLPAFKTIGSCPVPKPSKGTYDAANTIRTHSAVQSLFWEVTTCEPWTSGWPLDETKKDHVMSAGLARPVLDQIVAEISSPIVTCEEALRPFSADSAVTTGTGTTGADDGRARRRALVFGSRTEDDSKKRKLGGFSGRSKTGSGSRDLQMAWKK